MLFQNNLKIATELEKSFRNSSGFLNLYDQSFICETTQIISQLQNGFEKSIEDKFYSYKVSSKYSLTFKIKIALYRILILGFKQSKDTYKKCSNNPLKVNSNLLFLVEYHNHVSIYKKLVELDCSLSHQLVFLSEELYNKENKTGYLFHHFINKKRIPILYIKYISLSILIALKGIIKVPYSGVSRLSFSIEQLYMNSKFLFDFLLMVELGKTFNQQKNYTLVSFKAESILFRTLMLLAKKNETICIQHGIIFKEIKFFNIPVKNYLVWSTSNADALNESHCNCNIIAIGNPAYDNFYKNLSNQEQEQSYEFTNNIIFLPNSGNSTTPIEDIITAFKTYSIASKNHSELNFHVKPHPLDMNHTIEKQYLQLDLDLKSRINLIDQKSKVDYQNYDLIVTMNSTTGFEAGMYLKPLIILINKKEDLFISEYSAFNICSLATNIDELTMKIKHMLENYSNYKENCIVFRSNYLANPGKAGEMIIEFLKTKKNANSQIEEMNLRDLNLK